MDGSLLNVASERGAAGGLQGRYRELPQTAAELRDQQREMREQTPQQQQQRSLDQRSKQTRFADPAAVIGSDDAYDRPVRSKGCFGCFS